MKHSYPCGNKISSFQVVNTDQNLYIIFFPELLKSVAIFIYILIDITLILLNVVSGNSGPFRVI
jgi:hypothetical protein